MPVGRRLADRLLLPLEIVVWRHRLQSEFLTLPLTRSSLTHLVVLRAFLDVPIDVSQTDRGVRVVVG